MKCQNIVYKSSQVSPDYIVGKYDTTWTYRPYSLVQWEVYNLLDSPHVWLLYPEPILGNYTI